MRGDPDVPVACSLEPVDLDDRVRQWLALAERAMIEKQNVANGVRLRYRSLAGVDTELTALAAAEKHCCAFADWTATTAGDEVLWNVTAEGLGIEVVQLLFEQ